MHVLKIVLAVLGGLASVALVCIIALILVYAGILAYCRKPCEIPGGQSAEAKTHPYM